MTGPAYGKLPVAKAKILVNGKKLDGHVYIHVKGFARANVTHLDIEGRLRVQGFFTIKGIRGGIEIIAGKRRIRVMHKLLNRVLKPGQRTRTWVGAKYGGIYIGFRKPQIAQLEKLARKEFSFEF